MKEKTAKIIVIALSLILLMTVFIGCSEDGVKGWENREISDDLDSRYKDYYQLCVYSFADGDGDGKGDFKGITDKLQYIADLGFTGIWLSPIHPSPSYHKYDVIDYYDVDSEYGTLDDFDTMVKSAHKLGISIMMDLVINHSSNQNQWFVDAFSAHKNNTVSQYEDYYTFTGDYSYETFGGYGSMPKLNLSSDLVKEEIKNIMTFWLERHDVDGFRLDAAYHYFNTNTEKNIQFLTWLNNEAKKIKSSCYMVGEVWASDTTIKSHYKEGTSIDSFFNFSLSNASGYNNLFPIITGGSAERGEQYATLVTDKESNMSGGIDAIFAGNHDMSRVSNIGLPYYSSREESVSESLMRKHKMGIASLYTMNGNIFSYYGNEIGLRNGINNVDIDSGDPTYRIAMNWGAEYITSHGSDFAFATYGSDTGFGEYQDLLGGVAEQRGDQNSLYNFYRRILLLRKQNVEIARGESRIVPMENAQICAIVRTYNGKSVLLVYNFDNIDSVTIDISSTLKDYKMTSLVGYLTSDNSEDVTLSNNTLKLPPYSIAVIR
ncbi:MAG: alpha-amylase family glycosyl hydrolase [Clostridia bacterium]